MKTLFLTVFFFASTISAHAQLFTIDKALHASDFTLRVLDTTSTHANLNNRCNCFYEKNTFAPSGKGWSGEVFYQAGWFAIYNGGSELLKRHNHPRLARVLLIADIVQETYAVQNNMRMGRGK